jgi:integrase
VYCLNEFNTEVYNSDELQKLFEVAKGTELEIGIMLLVCLGIRRGELMGLVWSAIDFDKKLIRIDKNVVKVKGKKTVTKDPKSESGKRVIEAPDVLISFLRRERTEYWKRKLLHGADYHDNDLVVCQPNGKPFEVDYYSRKFRRLLEVNNLKIIRLHDLRHSHATYMLRLGVNVKAMQKRMGHSTFSTTMDCYAHVLDDMGREAADTLNTGLRGIVNAI